MKPAVRRRLRRGAIIVGAIIVAGSLLTGLERRRLRSGGLEPARATAGAIDGQRVLADVDALASAKFEGRRTGTPGSRAAQEFIIGRLRAANAHAAFGSSYRQPFSFTHHSIRGLVSPSRPHEGTHYPAAANVGGVIRGTSSPERFLALTAHYDSFGIRDGRMYPGADDNASGVAVMLAVAPLLAASPLRHSVLLLAFDAEELGLRGARHFVENPPVDLALLDTLVNLDMVGRGDDNVLVAAGTSHYPALGAPVRAAAATRGIQLMFGHDRPMYKAGLVEDWTGSSDHAPFHAKGIPFLYLGVEDHADYHQPTDTADKIPSRFLGEVGTLVADLMRHLDALPARQTR